MANSLVQRRDSSNTLNSISLAYTSNNTAGNLLVCAIGWPNPTTAGLAVSDTLNGAWTQDVAPATSSGNSCVIYSFKGCAGGANTVTASITSSSSFLELVIYEFSGGGNTFWTKTTSIGAASPSSGIANPGTMTVNVGDACFSYAFVGGTVSGGGSGWTFTATGNNNGSQYIISTGTSVTGSFSPSQPKWAAASAAYKSLPNAFVQQRNSNTTTSNSISLAYTSANAAGNLLVAALSWNNTTTTGVSVSDTLNGAWTQDVIQPGAGVSGSGVTTAVYSFKGGAHAGANTVTASVTSSSFLELVIYEFSCGRAIAQWNLTRSIGAFSLATSNPDPGSMTVNLGDACISYAYVAGSATGAAAGWNFTAATTSNNGTAYLLAPSTTVDGSFTPTQTSWDAASAAYNSATATALHFLLQVADTSTVSALGIENQRRFPMAIADTSTVSALGIRVNRRFLTQIADTSTVSALGIENQRHFPTAVADTSTVVALGIENQRRFPMAVADTSTVSALSIENQRHFPMAVADTSTVIHLGPTLRHFPMPVADTSTVIALGIEVQRHLLVQIADTSSVSLVFRINLFFPFSVSDSSTIVALGWHSVIFPQPPYDFPPYAGQDQPTKIKVPAVIAYKYIDWEEGPWVMPPYAAIFTTPPQQPLRRYVPAPIIRNGRRSVIPIRPPVLASNQDLVPPPIYRTDVWSANQTYPL